MNMTIIKLMIVVYDNITYMQQHSVMFNDTLEYNLTLGNTVSEELLSQSIDKANLKGL